MRQVQNFLFLVVLAPVICHAGIVYTYTGGPFESYSGSWAGGGVPTNMTASLTFDHPLPANMGWQILALPTAWSIGDGLHSFNQSSPNQNGSVLYFSTDALGHINHWAFRAIYVLPGNYYEDLQTAYYPREQGGGLSDGTSESIGSSPGLGIANNYNNVGTWSMSEASEMVPEPGTVLLIASALCLLNCTRRIRDNRRRA